MDFNLKTYKCLKIKYYFKKINFFFFFHGTSLNSTNWVKVEQLLNKDELKYFRVLNTLLINVLNNSIFKNLIILIHGPIVLVHTNSTKLIFKKFYNISPWISLLGLKLNNKIYSKKQIKTLKKLSYVENVYGFYNSVQFFTKMPYSKFRNEKIAQISK
jgi:ribosomal protein L10